MGIRYKAAEWGASAAVRFPRAFWAAYRAREWVRKKRREATPGQRAWRGAAAGLALATLVVVADGLLHRALLPYPTLDRAAIALRALRDAALWGVGLVLLASLIGRMPWRYRLALGVCGGILASSFPFSMDERGLVWALLAFSAAGAGMAAISRGDPDELTPLQRRIAIGGIVLGVGTAASFGYWMFNPGFDPLEYRNAAVEATTDGGAVVHPLSLPNPSSPGRYEVGYLTYGSGDDIRRAEFGRDADLTTPTVDGRPFLSSWDGERGEERKSFWGFGRDELPLQGRVWYPQGAESAGPFPLVLVVHGNHSMYEYSDPGYEYLGRLLASRGFILVSVDENFINGAIGGENDARGWLLLEHLKQWRRWDEGEGDTRFDGAVDMERIGLIGHSRGGEAVAVAAAFNTLPYYPDDATVPFDYGFDIGAVIAIAPVTGQYRPGGRYTELRDVNYFVIHGANDGDVSSFSGAIQYENVAFSGGPYRFKASLYVLGANHGQFNQVWGAWDSGAPFGRTLSTRSLIEEEEQRKIAKVYISAFLEATLRGELDYVPLFADARAGREWLPDTAYLAEFDDARSRVVAGFDEDVDVTTATIAGGRTRGENLNVWREQSVSLKSRDKDTAGVYLGWEVEEEEEAADGASEATGDPAATARAAGGSSPSAGPSAGPSAEIVVEPAGVSEATGDSPADLDRDSQANAGDAGDAGMDPGSGDAGVPRYVIELPEGFTTSPAATLFFSLADANESSSVPEHLREQDQDEQTSGDGQSQQGRAAQGQQQGDRADQQQGEEGEQQQGGEVEQQRVDDQADDAEESGDDAAGDDEDDEDDDDEPREPIDLTVRLVDAAGAVAELPLSRFSLVQPQLEVQLRKAFLDEPRTESETVFQSFLFPLAWFQAANAAFDASRPVRIELVFDRSPSGVVVLDTVGFRGPPGS